MKSDKDDTIIGGKGSISSAATLESTTKSTRTHRTTSAGGSVTSHSSAATIKTRRKRMQEKLRRKLRRINTTGTQFDGTKTDCRDAENEANHNNQLGSPSCESTKSSGTWKSRRHTAPSLSFGYGKRQRSHQGSTNESDDPALLGFGAVPPSTKKGHRKSMKKILSPRLPASVLSTKDVQEGKDSTTSQTSKRYYLTKTSIMQHSIHVDSNDEPYDEETSAKQDEGEFDQNDSEHTNLDSQRQNTRTEESIECIFSTMTFQDSFQLHSASEDQAETDTKSSANRQHNSDNMFSSCFEESPRDCSSDRPNGLGSFFRLCGDPNWVDDECGMKKIEISNDSPTSLWPFRYGQREAVSEKKAERKREPTVVHVTDIVSQKRDFTLFLKAYDELLEISKQQASLRDMAQSRHAPIHGTITIQNNDHRMCSFCPKYPLCSIPPTPQPNCWPQYPICLRATPGTGMRVLGVRFSSSSTYFDSASWWKSLGIPNPEGLNHAAGNSALCENCQLLPINSGFEAHGKALVIDFESELFIGTLLMRIRNSRPLKSVEHLGTAGADYFASANRKYQAVIRGEFKRPVPANRSVTGQVFPHEVTNLPSKLWLKTALSVISVFAPQLQANVDGSALEGIHGPSFISPLASTPQSVMVQIPEQGDGDALNASSFVQRRHADMSMDRPLVEPATDSQQSLVSEYRLQQAKAGVSISTSAARTKNVSESSSSERAKVRKKYLDKDYAQGPSNESCFMFQPGKIYTFEFLQHLLNFETYTLEVGTSMKLNETLNGQPLKCMAAHLEEIQGETTSNGKSGTKTPMMKLKHLWSFDIWHQGLYKDAMTYAELESSNRSVTASPKKDKKH